MRRFYTLTKGHEDQPRDDHGRWSSDGGSAADNERVASVVRNTVRTTTPEEQAHYAAAGGWRVPLPPHLAAARAERYQRQDAEVARQERENIANERAMRAAGHLGEVPHAALDQYPAARQAASGAVTGIRTTLNAHHDAAAQALADLHARDHEEKLSVTRDLVEHFADTSGQLGELSGDQNGPSFDHVSERDHLDEHSSADFGAHAERAQSTLEALHAQQIQAAGDLRAADRMHSRAARAVRSEADIDPADLALSDHPQAHAAAESLLAHESRMREDITSGMSFEDAHNALADETRATARAVRELSRITGRAPNLPKKTKKARRRRRRQIYTPAPAMSAGY